MKENGLAKLIEECGEVLQIAGKLIQYPELQKSEMSHYMHPDGSYLRERLETELGDLLAAITFVSQKMRLNSADVHHRATVKLATFNEWDKVNDNGETA